MCGDYSKLRFGGVSVERLITGDIKAIHPRREQDFRYRDIPDNMRTYPVDIREPYQTSEYVANFLTKMPGATNVSAVREEAGMKFRTNLRNLLEELEAAEAELVPDVDADADSGEVPGNDDLGSPNFEPQAAAPDMTGLADQGDDVDVDPPSVTVNDEAKGEAEEEPSEEVKVDAAEIIATEGIRTKQQYYFVLEMLVSEVCKHALFENIPKKLRNTTQTKIMHNTLREAVLYDKLPAFDSEMKLRSAKRLVSTIVSIQEQAMDFARKPTKRNAEIVERMYLYLRKQK